MPRLSKKGLLGGSHSASGDEGYQQLLPRPPKAAAGQPKRRTCGFKPIPPPPARLDSYEFTPTYNAVADAYNALRTEASFRKRSLARWVLNVIIGVCVALLAVGVTWASRQLTSLKYSVMNSVIAAEKAGTAAPGMAFLALCGIAAGYAVLASLPSSFIEPASAGSGIPEVKSVLNGVRLPRVLRFRTLVCKMFGNVFSVSSGLPVGKEGPMIHAGAAVAAGFSQGKSTTLGFDTRWSVWNDFRNDQEKRDFVVCGAASGVAAAFGAPIGGVLFAIEEGASHWHRALVWRSFMSSAVTAYILEVFLSGINNGSQWGQLGSPGMFSFGSFTSTSWTWWELPIYILIGVAGGLLGALFVAVNKRITQWRFRVVPATIPYRRFLEAVIIATLWAATTFGVPRLLAVCKPRPASNGTDSYNDDLQSFYCAPDEYSELASLFMVAAEDAIKQLFHFSADFSFGHLAIFGTIYTIFSCITYGIAVPSGLFIPALLSGSAFGRMIGQFLNLILPGSAAVSPGVFSIIGASAVLGGTTRLSISLAVILLECTNQYTLVLPLMLTLMASRFVGNAFNEGIYDLHVSLRKWPVLEEKVPAALQKQLRVCDVMAPAPVCFREIEKVGNVVDILKATTHGAFPVVFKNETLAAYPRLGTLAGLIQRRYLGVILEKRAFHASLPAQPLDHLSKAGGAPDGSGAGYPVSPATGNLAAGAAALAAGSQILRSAGAGGFSSPGLGEGSGLASSSRASTAGFVSPPAAGRTPGATPVSVPTPASVASASSASSTIPLRMLHVPPPSPRTVRAAGLDPRKIMAEVAAGGGPLALAAGGPDASALAVAGYKDQVALKRLSRPVSSSGLTQGGGGGGGLNSPQPTSGSATTPIPQGRAPAASLPVPSAGTTAPINMGNATSALGLGTPDETELPASLSAARLQGTGASSVAGSSFGTDAGLPPPALSGAPAPVPQPGAVAGKASGKAPAPAPAPPRILSLFSGNSGSKSSKAGAASGAAASSVPAAGSLSLNGGASLSSSLPRAAILSSSPGSSLSVRLRLPSVPNINVDKILSASRKGSLDDAEDGAMEIDLAHHQRGAAVGSSASVSGGGPAASLPSAHGWAGSHSPGILMTPPSAAAAASGGSGAASALASVSEAAGSAASAAAASALEPYATGNNMAFVATGDDLIEFIYEDEPLITYPEIRKHYPRFPDVNAMSFTPEEREMWIDLRPYCNPTPLTVNVHAPLQAAFALFRGLGLRHLPVVNDCHDIAGMVTRHDLTHHHLQECLKRKILASNARLYEVVAGAGAAAQR